MLAEGQFNTTYVAPMEVSTMSLQDRWCKEIGNPEDPVGLIPNTSRLCNKFINTYAKCFGGFRINAVFCLCMGMSEHCLDNNEDYLLKNLECSKEISELKEPISELPTDTFFCYTKFDEMQACFNWTKNKRSCYCLGIKFHCSEEEYALYSKRFDEQYIKHKTRSSYRRFLDMLDLHIIIICIFSINMLFGITGKI